MSFFSSCSSLSLFSRCVKTYGEILGVHVFHKICFILKVDTELGKEEGQREIRGNSLRIFADILTRFPEDIAFNPLWPAFFQSTEKSIERLPVEVNTTSGFLADFPYQETFAFALFCKASPRDKRETLHIWEQKPFGLVRFHSKRHLLQRREELCVTLFLDYI